MLSRQRLSHVADHTTPSIRLRGVPHKSDLASYRATLRAHCWHREGSFGRLPRYACRGLFPRPPSVLIFFTSLQVSTEVDSRARPTCPSGRSRRCSRKSRTLNASATSNHCAFVVVRVELRASLTVSWRTRCVVVFFGSRCCVLTLLLLTGQARQQGRMDLSFHRLPQSSPDRFDRSPARPSDPRLHRQVLRRSAPVRRVDLRQQDSYDVRVWQALFGTGMSWNCSLRGTFCAQGCRRA